MQKPKNYVLRGYTAQRPDGRFIGVYLKPNLVVEGGSQQEAFSKLHDLLEAYLVDAFKDGTLDHLMSQRAPARFYLEYATGRLRELFHSLNSSFQPFTETKNTSQYA